VSDRYRPIALMGGGGMAEVYLAIATGAEGFEKPVAIKRLLPHLARDEGVARMFLTEARLAMHLHHQNIVSVIDVGRGPDGLFLVMELVDGWDLGVVLGHAAKVRRWMPEALAMYVGTQVAAGLSHAYRKTQPDGRPVMAAHRDLSPSNVLVTLEGEVKVADFGIAKVESSGTEPGAFKGKVPYSAPEVLRGATASHLSDQFSLGVALHRLTTGQYPYGYHDNVVAYADHLRQAGPPACPGLSPGFAAVLKRMLALVPEARYRSIDEAGAALAEQVARSGVVAGARELGAYLTQLSLPPPPSIRAREPATPAAAPLPALTLVDRPSAAAGGGGALDADWQPSAGVELSASGRLIQSGDRRPQSRSPDAPTPEAREPAPELVSDSAQYWQPPPAQPQQEAPRPFEPTPAYEPLPGRYQAPPRRRAPVKWLAVGALLLLAGGAYLYFTPERMRVRLPRLGGPPQQAILLITSEPDGATVKINGQAVGTTPFSQDNVYPPDREMKVEVVLRGYKPWTGTFRGGESATLEAQLRR
jgi:serine/threonine-protein kinase